MESIIFEIATKYGIEGLLCGALVFVCIMFDRHLTKRDERDEKHRDALVDIIKENTEINTRLIMIIEERVKRG